MIVLEHLNKHALVGLSICRTCVYVSISLFSVDVCTCASLTQRCHTHTHHPISQEQITEQAYNEKSDIWSLACIIYELAALRPPFDATSQAALAVKIKAGHFDRLPAQYSSELNSVIRCGVAAFAVLWIFFAIFKT